MYFCICGQINLAIKIEMSPQNITVKTMATIKIFRPNQQSIIMANNRDYHHSSDPIRTKIVHQMSYIWTNEVDHMPIFNATFKSGVSIKIDVLL